VATRRQFLSLLKRRSIWLRHLYLALSCAIGSRLLLFEGMTASTSALAISSRMSYPTDEWFAM